jgi:TBC1 domain family member 14
LLTKTDYAAFILFHNIVTKSNLFPFYRFDDTYMKQRIVIFKQIFGYNLQDLCFHFEDEGIQPNLYLYEWFMSLFAKALNIDIVCRVWDLILLDGISILYKTAIVILSTLEEELLESDFDDIMKLLRNTSNSITNEDEFIEAILKINLPQWIDLELPILEKNQLPDELI